MNEPIIQGKALGCPHCPTRRECACPDGPTTCPDNDACPCDKTVCPCGKYAHQPEPPGCLRGPLAVGLGILGIIVLLIGAFLVFGRGDDDNGSLQSSITTPGSEAVAAESVPDTPPATEAAVAPVTDPAPPPATDPAPPPETEPPATEPPAPPAFQPPVVDPGVISIIDDAFGGEQTLTSADCHVVTPGMRQIDQTGGTALSDPSLDIDTVCLGRAPLGGVGVPMLDGVFLITVAIHGAPLDPDTNIGYQPGLSFDRSAVENGPVEESGEGILQVPGDAVAFGGGLDGWTEAQFFDLPGFGPSDLFGYVFARAGSPATIFAIPSELLPPDTVVNFQSFGRLTEPGNSAGADDPAASTLVLGGPAPCVGPCGPPSGRFTVELVDGGDPASTFGGVEGDDGFFWFTDTDTIVRVLDACNVGDSNTFWVFAGSLTDVPYDFTVVDTGSSLSQTYPGLSASSPPIMDTQAFATCP